MKPTADYSDRVSTFSLRHSLGIGHWSLVIFLALVPPSHSEPLLKSGDRLVFLGDSITEQQIYPRYVMDYFALRYPGMAVSFRNRGWSGDTAPGGAARLAGDVLHLKPTVVCICFGMNDGAYRAFEQPILDRYMQGMNSLVALSKGAGVKVVLLTPGCVDPDRRPDLKDYNATLARLAAAVKELAAKENLPVCDLHTLMLDVQTKAKAGNPSFTMIPDAIHPDQQGAAVMAYGLLKTLGCTEPASALAIDAAKAAATPARCTVTDLKVTTNAITFARTDAALPTFFDPQAAPVFKYCPIIEELNRYDFKVTGLAVGTWKLSVAGIEVGAFTAEQLAQGVNLAPLPGPWQTLAAEVNRLSQEQGWCDVNRYRNVQHVAIPAEAIPERDALLRKVDEVIAAREQARIELPTKKRTWDWKLQLTP